MSSTLDVIGPPAIRRSAARPYADLRSPATPPRRRPGPAPGPRLERVNPPPRTSGVDLLWVLPLSVVVTVGSFFTNLAEEHAAPSGYQPWLAAALGACAAAGFLVSLRWPLRGAVTTYAAVTVFVLADLEDGPIYLSLAVVGFLVAARVPVAVWLRVAVAGTLAVCAAQVVRVVADY